ncbi:hypothetical protein BGX28_009026 [Mortierella sp. GBA30]|nr:hypothetical protein BGX28_009026 [Mortierella sp. GBA30]
MKIKNPRIKPIRRSRRAEAGDLTADLQLEEQFRLLSPVETDNQISRATSQQDPEPRKQMPRDGGYDKVGKRGRMCQLLVVTVMETQCRTIEQAPGLEIPRQTAAVPAGADKRYAERSQDHLKSDLTLLSGVNISDLRKAPSEHPGRLTYRPVMHHKMSYKNQVCMIDPICDEPSLIPSEREADVQEFNIHETVLEHTPTTDPEGLGDNASMYDPVVVGIDPGLRAPAIATILTSGTPDVASRMSVKSGPFKSISSKYLDDVDRAKSRFNVEAAEQSIQRIHYPAIVLGHEPLGFA